MNQTHVNKLIEGTNAMNANIQSIEQNIAKISKDLSTLEMHFIEHTKRNYTLREQLITLLKKELAATNESNLTIKDKRDRNLILSSVNSLLHDFKTCGICYYEMKDQIFNCKEGHILCKSCFAKVNRCPYCKSNIIVRNRIIEQLLHTTNEHILQAKNDVDLPNF